MALHRVPVPAVQYVSSILSEEGNSNRLVLDDSPYGLVFEVRVCNGRSRVPRKARVICKSTLLDLEVSGGGTGRLAHDSVTRDLLPLLVSISLCSEVREGALRVFTPACTACRRVSTLLYSSRICLLSSDLVVMGCLRVLSGGNQQGYPSRDCSLHDSSVWFRQAGAGNGARTSLPCLCRAAEGLLFSRSPDRALGETS